jgi:hypothetical protein
MCYALRVTRAPTPHVIVCHGGGFIGSGDVHNSKAPQVFLPLGVEPFTDEGFGEGKFRATLIHGL